MRRPDLPQSVQSLIGWRGLLATSAAAVVLMNALLVIQNRRLREDPPSTEVESRVTELAGINVETRQYQTFPFRVDRRFLILTYSGGCPRCRESLDEWRAVTSRLNRSKWSVVIVSRDSVSFSSSFTNTGIDGAMLADVPHRLYVQLGLAAVPKAIVLASDGTVTGAIRGRMDSVKVAALERLLQ